MKLTTRVAYTVLPSYVWSTIVEELRFTRSRWLSHLLIRRSAANALLNDKGGKLHLGCGARVRADWFNVDGNGDSDIDLRWDLRKPLPFASESCRLIYSEHLLEHLTREDAERVIAECYRLLKPAGRLRIGVPDAELYIRAYAEGRKEFFKDLAHLGGAVDPLLMPIDVINQMFRMGGAHQFAWDFSRLASSLSNGGFKNVTRYEPSHASTAEICLDDPEHAFETLYVEASK